MHNDGAQRIWHDDNKALIVVCLCVFATQSSRFVSQSSRQKRVSWCCTAVELLFDILSLFNFTSLQFCFLVYFSWTALNKWPPIYTYINISSSILCPFLSKGKSPFGRQTVPSEDARAAQLGECRLLQCWLVSDTPIHRFERPDPC